MVGDGWKPAHEPLQIDMGPLEFFNQFWSKTAENSYEDFQKWRGYWNVKRTDDQISFTMPLYGVPFRPYTKVIQNLTIMEKS